MFGPRQSIRLGNRLAAEIVPATHPFDTMTSTTHRRRFLASLGLAVLAASAAAQDAPRGGLPPGVSREQMWPAPTAEDWQRPCLVRFQRTWEDAVAVARETSRAILVCINMDGEIASEHYAGIRYRQPEIAALYEPYVCVIASTYRHNPRDYDEEGRRLLCPRFGSVTCGEHIAIEPGLFEKFMDGQRIAPRHIMVELDGSEVYDVYYAWDTDSVFKAIGDGIANRKTQPTPVVRGDRSILERVASPDNQDRTAVEAAYAEGDPGVKKSLLDAATAMGDTAPADLLRLAIFGFDVDLSRSARSALSKSESPASVDLISEALRVPMETKEKENLVGALERIGETSSRARTLATVHRGLAGQSSDVDVKRWSGAFQSGATYRPAIEAAVVDSRLNSQDDVLGGDDADARLELAEALLARATNRMGYTDPTRLGGLNPKIEEKEARLLLQDAHRIALEAEKMGAKGWRVDAAIAVSAYYLGKDDVAHPRAAAAVKGMPPDAPGWNAMVVLALFAESRWQSILMSVNAKRPWPPEWLADVDAAYNVLARHPDGNDGQVAMHYDIVKWLGGAGQAARVLDTGLARFPDSWALHERLRSRILEEKGVNGLEATYDAMLESAKRGRSEPDASLEWYAGYASFVTAEFRRRRGGDDPAFSAYDRAIAHFERAAAADSESRDSSDHYVALALAGRSRLFLERDEYDRAVDELVSCFERRPDAAGTLDGLNISPSDTARMLKARLTDRKRDDLLAKLDAALAKLDPALLELPAYERGGPPPGAPPPGGEGRRGRRPPSDR